MLEDSSLAMLSAALRHTRDAEHLASAPVPDRSLDQAYHIAGYGPECARKAAIPKRTYDLAIGHGVGPKSEIALQFALAIDPVAHRYDLEGWESRYPCLASWRETCRYESTGRRTQAEVEDLISEARGIVDQLVFSLWADGLVPSGFSW